MPCILCVVDTVLVERNNEISDNPGRIGSFSADTHDVTFSAEI